MTEDEVPEATKLTFFMRNGTVISVHVNDALPLTHSSLWNCTPTCVLDLTDELCKALCQFDNKSKHDYNACLSKMENRNIQFVFEHDKKDEALKMAKDYEVVIDMMEELFKPIDVEMTDIFVKIEIPAPTKNPLTRKSPPPQKAAGRSHDREQKPDNSAEQETATMGNVTTKGVDGTGTAIRSIVGGTVITGKVIQAQGDVYEGSEASKMADTQKQNIMESKSIHGKIRHIRSEVTRFPDGTETVETEFQFPDNDEAYYSTCKSVWSCEPQPDKKVLNVAPSSRVRNLLNEIRDFFWRKYSAKLTEVRSGSIVFVFEHETREDALQMIKSHREVEHLLYHCLHQLDSEVEDITLHIKLKDLSQSDRKADTTEYSSLKRKAIISNSVSTQKDYPSADTSQTSSGGSGEVLHDCSNKQKCQEIVRGLKQQITALNIELGKKDEQIKDYERAQLAETRMVLWMRPESSPLTETSGYHSTDGSAASVSDVHDQQTESGHAQEHEGQLPQITSRWEVQDGNMKLISYDRNSMLMQACLDEKVLIVKQLLSSSSVDINTRTKAGWAPALIAAFKGNIELLSLLVKENCDLSVKLDDGKNIIHVACLSEKVDIVEDLLSCFVAGIESRDKTGKTPVMYAAQKGNKKVVDLLVGNGCNLSVVDDLGRNILHEACLGDNVDIVEDLLWRGVADIDCKDREGRTPVMYAAQKGSKEVVDLLVGNGCNLSVVDDLGRNILHEACLVDNVDIVKYLLWCGIADIDCKDREGRTPVMYAAQKGSKKVVDLLVGNGCNLSVVDDLGRNILHEACLVDNVDIVEYLLRRGVADIDCRDREGRTPVMYAAQKGYKEVVDLLLGNGCNLSVVDDLGRNNLR